MQLFLASKLAESTTWDHFQNYFGGLSDKKVAYLVTAANALGRGRWRELTLTKRLQETNVATLEIIELEDFQNKDIPSLVEKCDILITSGGYTGYLLYWLHFTKLDAFFKEMITIKNIPYAGSSSGSMVLSQTQFASEYLLSEPEPGASFIPGLGIIDFEIWPHFDPKTESIEAITKLHNWHDLYVLKDGEYITVNDGSLKLFGEERRIRYNYQHE